MRRILIAIAIVCCWLTAALAAEGIINVTGGLGGGGPPQNPLRIVATNGAVPNVLVAQAATPGRSQTISRIPIVFGCTATAVTFRFDNWYANNGGTVDAADSTGAAQPVTIVGLALEPGGTAPSGTTNVLTPITFSGANGTTIASGGSAQSDALPGPFTANSFYWIRVTATVPNPGGANNLNWLFGPAADPNFVGPNGAGDVAANYVYPPGQNIAQVYRAGPFTAPLNVAISRTQGFGPTATLGRCTTTGNISVVNIGASWSFGVDDPYAAPPTGCATNNTAISTGLGLIAHAALNNGVVSGQTIPFVKISVAGTGTGDAAAWVNGTATGRAQPYLGLANVLFDDMGANDIGTLTAAQIETANSNLWAQAKSLGVQKVVVMQMTQRTTSTDNWVTTANQTASTSFTVGTSADQVNIDYAGSLASQINGVLTAGVGGTPATGSRSVAFSSCAPGPPLACPAGYWLWQVNGAVNGYTCAGLHLNSSSYPTVGTELRNILLGLTGLN